MIGLMKREWAIPTVVAAVGVAFVFVAGDLFDWSRGVMGSVGMGVVAITVVLATSLRDFDSDGGS
jgi:hypothetical protein